MSQFKNPRLLKAIAREPLDRTPIWIMRQAGRYLPEYQQTRRKAGNFMNLCKTPELACEVTLQPITRYGLDAAIIFSDILTIPDAMGLGLTFVEGKGPLFAKSIMTESDIQQLTVPDSEKLAYVYEAIKLTKQALNQQIPLIGFCGSPWTLACYVLEGRSAPGFPQIFKLLKAQPTLLHQLLQCLTHAIIQHLTAQIAAGADVVMLFDTWGGLLKDHDQDYEFYSLNYLKNIIAALPATTPVILFTKGGSQWLEKIAQSGCQVIGLDWTLSLKEARARTHHQICLQGNLNPDILQNAPANIRENVYQLLQSYGNGSGHIFNLGHGITPQVPPDHVKVLVDAVHELSPAFHGDV